MPCAILTENRILEELQIESMSLSREMAEALSKFNESIPKEYQSNKTS